jgi:hypothetical protein
MAGKAISISLHVEGARETLAAFRRLPKDASKALRERSLELATALARKVSAAASSDSPQSALIAPTVKPRRDRIPFIEAGGSSRVGRNRVPAYKVIFGSEFGARTLPQYRAHVGKGSYWMFKTVEANEAEIMATWMKAAADIQRDFESGG